MIPTESYPAEHHWARRQMLGLDSPPPAFSVPAIAILEKLAGHSDEEASVRRSQAMVDSLLAPPSQPPSYDAAKSAILGLCAPHPDQGDEERNASVAINLEALSFFATLDRFLEARSGAKRLALERRYEQVYQLCRTTSDRVAELEQQNGYHRNLLLGLDDRRAKCAGEVNAINALRPSRFPSAEEIRIWRSELDGAKAELAVAVREHREGEEMVDQVVFELQNSQRELAALESEEKELRKQLEDKNVHLRS